MLNETKENGQCYVIVDWSENHENHQSRKYKQLQWVKLTNSFDDECLTTLLRSGASVFGAWIALLMIASKCRHRGVLVLKNGRAHDAGTLSRQSGIDKKTFQKMLDVASEAGLVALHPLNEYIKRGPSADQARPTHTSSASQARKIEGTEQKEENTHTVESRCDDSPDNVCVSGSPIILNGESTNPPNVHDSGDSGLSSFDLFWAKYPKHTAIDDAKHTWIEQNCHPHLREILDAIEKQKETDQWKKRHVIPHAANWLKQRRWLDEVSDPSGTPKRSQAEIDKAMANRPMPISREVEEASRKAKMQEVEQRRAKAAQMVGNTNTTTRA